MVVLAKEPVFFVCVGRQQQNEDFSSERLGFTLDLIVVQRTQMQTHLHADIYFN